MLTFVSLLMMIDFEGQISTSEMKSIPPCINTYSTQDLIFRTDMICVKVKLGVMVGKVIYFSKVKITGHFTEGFYLTYE